MDRIQVLQIGMSPMFLTGYCPEHGPANYHTIELPDMINTAKTHLDLRHPVVIKFYIVHYSEDSRRDVFAALERWDGLKRLLSMSLNYKEFESGGPIERRSSLFGHFDHFLSLLSNK